MEQLLEFFNNNYKNHDRYWWQGENRFITDPETHTLFNSEILRIAHMVKERGRALDIGAGEGAQSIRLAKLGYEVDSIELSPIGCEKIEKSALSEKVKINVINGNFLFNNFKGKYNIILCNGVLHYVEHKQAFLDKIKGLTIERGYNIVSSFTDFTPVPDVHKIVPVYADKEDGIIYQSYKHLKSRVLLQRNKVERSHTEFAEHSHSFIKLIAQLNNNYLQNSVPVIEVFNG